MPPVWSIIVFSIVIPVFCGFLGSLFHHWLTKSRDAATSKLARKRNFLTFLAVWKGEILTTNPQNYVTLRDVKNQSLRVEARLIREDFPETLQTEFDALVLTLAAVTNEQLVQGYQNRAPRDVWFDALDPLISFMERN